MPDRHTREPTRRVRSGVQVEGADPLAMPEMAGMPWGASGLEGAGVQPQIGYTPKALAERFDAQPAEIRRFLSGRLDPERTAELGAALRNAGIPT